MGKKMDNRQQTGAKPSNKILFVVVLALVSCLLGIGIPYIILSFIKHKDIIFDIEIFQDRNLWVWFGIILAIIFVGIIGFSIYYDLFNHSKLLNKTEAAKSDVYGDARFLTDKEIKSKFGDYNFDDLPNIDISGYLVASKRIHNQLRLSIVPKQHALICGVSGDGKSLRHLGVTIQLNAQSKTKPSMLINDIKGELWNMHSKFLKEQGYETILLDLRNPYTSYRLNPINIIWKLKKQAEETQLELSDNELNAYYLLYRIFKGYLSFEEFCSSLSEEEKSADLKTINSLYNNYKKYTEDLNIKNFPHALAEEPLKRFIDLPDNFNNLNDVDKYACLYHLFLDKYKLFVTTHKNLDRAAFYKEWQTAQFNKKMSKLNRASGLTIEFASQIVPEGTGENKQWSDGAQGICAAIITAMLEDGFSPELNFTEEMFSITQISNIVNRQRNEMEQFLMLRDFDSKVFDFAGPILNNPAEKTVAGYMSNMQTPLRHYLEDGIEYIMSGTDVSFEDIIAKPTAIFILVPEEFPARYTLASMYITQIYNELLYQSNDFAEQNYLLPRPFYFLLDEFGNSVKIPTLPSWVTLSRSRNIYFAFYVQALSQINKLYGESDMKTIVQNCHLQIIMGSNEQETIDHFYKNFGERTVVTRTANFDPKTSDIDFKGSSTLSKVDLVPPSMLRKISEGTIYWKIHKQNPGRTHIEHIFDNTDILHIGTFDKPAETFKPYDKNARIYNLAARNKYVKELNDLLNDSDSSEPGVSDGGDDGDGGAAASIPTGFVVASPEELNSYNKSSTNSSTTNNGSGGRDKNINPHTKLFDI